MTNDECFWVARYFFREPFPYRPVYVSILKIGWDSGDGSPRKSSRRQLGVGAIAVRR